MKWAGPAIVALGLSGFVAVAVAAVAYPYDLGHREGLLFLPAMRLVAGLPIYGEGAALTPPFVVSHYGPVYYFVLGWIVSVTGPAFWPGRLLSIVSCASIGAGLFHLARRRGATREAAALVAVLFLTLPGVWVFGTMLRVDLPGLALLFFGLLLAILGPPTLPRLLAGGAVTGLAVFVKPTLICAPLAVCLALALARKTKQVAAFVVGVSGVAALAWSAVALSGAGDLAFSLRVDAAGDYSVAGPISIASTAARSPAFLVCLVLWWFEAARLRRRATDPLLARFLQLYPALSLCAGLVMSMRGGSNINYLFEAFLGFALCAAFAFASDGTLVSSPATSRWRSVILAAVFLDLLVGHAGYVRGRFVFPWRQGPGCQAVIDRLKQLPQQAGPVLSAYPELALRAGHTPHFQTSHAYLVGSEPMRRAYRAFLDERRAAALILSAPSPPDGYVAVAGADAGPFLFFRKDLGPVIGVTR